MGVGNSGRCSNGSATSGPWVGTSPAIAGRPCYRHARPTIALLRQTPRVRDRGEGRHSNATSRKLVSVDPPSHYDGPTIGRPPHDGGATIDRSSRDDRATRPGASSAIHASCANDGIRRMYFRQERQDCGGCRYDQRVFHRHFPRSNSPSYRRSAWAWLCQGPAGLVHPIAAATTQFRIRAVEHSECAGFACMVYAESAHLENSAGGPAITLGVASCSHRLLAHERPATRTAPRCPSPSRHPMAGRPCCRHAKPMIARPQRHATRSLTWGDRAPQNSSRPD